MALLFSYQDGGETISLHADEPPYDDPNDPDRTNTPFRIDVDDAAGENLESHPIDTLKQAFDNLDAAGRQQMKLRALI